MNKAVILLVSGLCVPLAVLIGSQAGNDGGGFGFFLTAPVVGFVWWYVLRGPGKHVGQ